MTNFAEYLTYDPISGIITWKIDHGRKVKAGTRAGYVNRKYRFIELNGSRISEHRICYFLMKGCMPVDGIDHINGDGRDNRWSNLRACSQGENNQNLKCLSGKDGKSSRFVGVYWYKRREKWRASIKVNGKKITVGNFDIEEDAFLAYLEAKKRYHTFNPVPRDVDDAYRSIFARLVFYP